MTLPARAGSGTDVTDVVDGGARVAVPDVVEEQQASARVEWSWGTDTRSALNSILCYSDGYWPAL